MKNTTPPDSPAPPCVSCARCIDLLRVAAAQLYQESQDQEDNDLFLEGYHMALDHVGRFMTGGQ